MRKRTLFFGFLGSLILIILLSLVITHLKNRNDFLHYDKIEQVENRLGQPMYVFDRPNGWFGKNLINEDEFNDGLTIRVYVIAKMPPRFLVVKVAKGGKDILASDIETS